MNFLDTVNELLEESKQTESPKFKLWFDGSKIVDANGNPLVVYHGTNKKFSKFGLKHTTQNIIWFTTNKKAIESGSIGAQGSGHIMELYVQMKNPAGWKEYDNLMLAQLKSRGYDGVILDNKDGTFDGFVFSPKQIVIAK